MLGLQKQARPLTAITVAAVVAFAGAALAPAAVAKKTPSTLQGTVSWTINGSTNRDYYGSETMSETSTVTTTIKVKMTRELGIGGWQVQDNGSSYVGSYRLSGQRVKRNMDDEVCTETWTASGNAAGPLPKKPKSYSPPNLFAVIVPATSTLGSRTKAIGLSPILRFSGQRTDISTGSSCPSSATITYPVDGSLAPSDDLLQEICYPAGTSSKTAWPHGLNNLVGAWSRGEKAFIFNCQKTWDRGAGQQVTTTITGTLKPK